MRIALTLTVLFLCCAYSNAQLRFFKKEKPEKELCKNSTFYTNLVFSSLDSLLVDTCWQDTVYLQDSLNPATDSFVVYHDTVFVDSSKCKQFEFLLMKEDLTSSINLPFSLSMVQGKINLELFSIPEIQTFGFGVSFPVISTPSSITQLGGGLSYSQQKVLPVLRLRNEKNWNKFEFQSINTFLISKKNLSISSHSEFLHTLNQKTSIGIFAEVNTNPGEVELKIGPNIERGLGNFTLAIHGGWNIVERQNPSLSTHLIYNISVDKKKKVRVPKRHPLLRPIPIKDDTNHTIPDVVLSKQCADSIKNNKVIQTPECLDIISINNKTYKTREVSLKFINPIMGAMTTIHSGKDSLSTSLITGQSNLRNHEQGDGLNLVLIEALIMLLLKFIKSLRRKT